MINIIVVLNLSLILNKMFLQGYEVGCVSNYRWNLYQETEKQFCKGSELLNGFSLSPQKWDALGINVVYDGIMRR